jgi:hypothetical protein
MRAGALGRRSFMQCGSASGSVGGSEPGSAALEFEPNVACALVDPPAARDHVNSVEPQSADVVEISVANDPLESLPLVDDLDHQATLVKVPENLDPATPMNDRVRHQLGGQQPDVVELMIVQRLAKPLN